MNQQRKGFSTSLLRARQQEGDGFTLLELLVVLGVVALLVLIALPALARAAADTKVFQCVNSLRQWARSNQMYANENSDTIPRDGLSASGLYPGSGSSGNPNDTNAWFNVLPPYLTSPGLAYFYQLPGTDPRQRLPFPSNTNSPKIWQCPEAAMTDAEYATLSGAGAAGFFSYGMDIDLKQIYNPVAGSGGVMTYPKMPRTTALPKPSATVLMFDMAFNPREWPFGNGFFSVNPAGRWTVFATRHSNRQGGVIAFVDGHSKYFKWDYVYNQAPGATTQPNLNELHNPDIIWNPQLRAAFP